MRYKSIGLFFQIQNAAFCNAKGGVWKCKRITFRKPKDTFYE